MATIRVAVDPRLVTIALAGPVARDDIVQAISAWYPEVGSRSVLWDLMDADMSAFGEMDFHEIAEAAKLFVAPGGYRKVAYASPHPQVVMKVSRYANQALFVGTGAEYRAFQSVEQARRWLAMP